jgi:hypothetical protein
VRKLQPILEENLPHTVGTIIRKIFKKGTLNGKITSYDNEREYYMIEYTDGDLEELRHKTGPSSVRRIEKIIKNYEYSPGTLTRARFCLMMLNDWSLSRIIKDH